MEVREIHSKNEQDWDAFIFKSNGSLFETTKYKKVLENAYQLKSFYLAAYQSESCLVGTLPLFECPGFPSGKNLVTLPYSGNFGALRSNDTTIDQLLLDSAIKKAAEVGARTVEIRESSERLKGESRLLSDVSFSYFSLRLDGSTEEIWKSKLDTKARNQVRKAEKEGLSWKIGGTEFLSNFYEIYSKTMHRLGSPAHSFSFFRNFLNIFEKESQIAIVEYRNSPISCLWLVQDGLKILNPWAGSLKEFSSLCANNLNYWKSIEWASMRGAKTFEFGRSIRNSPHEKFKLQWGAEAIPIEHYFYLHKDKSLPKLNPDSAKVKLLQNVWRRIPNFAVNSFGSRLAKRVP